MKVRTPFDKPDFISTCAGDQFHILYTRVDKEDGSWYLKESGKEDIQEMINSACPPTIADIIERARRGDNSLLGSEADFAYGDFTEVSNKNIGDLVRMNESSKVYLEQAGRVDAPAEVKEGESSNESAG